MGTSEDACGPFLITNHMLIDQQQDFSPPAPNGPALNGPGSSAPARRPWLPLLLTPTTFWPGSGGRPRTGGGAYRSGPTRATPDSPPGAAGGQSLPSKHSPAGMARRMELLTKDFPEAGPGQGPMQPPAGCHGRLRLPLDREPAGWRRSHHNSRRQDRKGRPRPADADLLLQAGPAARISPSSYAGNKRQRHAWRAGKEPLNRGAAP